jgi:hypothetical protein
MRPKTLFASAAILFAMGALLFVSRPHKQSGTAKLSPVASPRSTASTRPEIDAQAHAFTTESGLLIPIPEGYDVQHSPAQLDPDLEIILVYPLEASPADLWKDPDRLRKGAVVVEAVPLTKIERAEPGLRERLERDTMAAAKRQGWVLSMERHEGLALPATDFTVKNPAHQRVYLFDKGHVYKFSSGPGSLGMLATMLRGVRRSG